jgi:hypothetical protein
MYQEKSGNPGWYQVLLLCSAGMHAWFQTRVARWHNFKPKIIIWVNFGGTHNGRYWYILWPFGLYIWYILRPCGILYGYLVYSFSFWYVAPRKICATLCQTKNA